MPDLLGSDAGAAGYEEEQVPARQVAGTVVDRLLVACFAVAFPVAAIGSCAMGSLDLAVAGCSAAGGPD